jgi:hypothetical protein
VGFPTRSVVGGRVYLWIMETTTTTAPHPTAGAADVAVGDASPHPLVVLVERVRARFGEELPPALWSMSDDDVVELLASLQGLAAQVDAALLAGIREADCRDLGKRAGATSTARWLSGLLRTRPGQASRRVKLARDLDTTLVPTQAMLTTGEISVEHADVIAQTLRDLPAAAGPDVRFAAEQAMLEHTEVMNPKDLATIGSTILNAVDPELADHLLAKQLADQEAREARQRELSLSDDPYSTSSFLRGKLDAETTELLRVALEPLAKPRPTTADGPDLRTSGQRMGDGFHELLRRYLDSGASPTHAGEKPHLVITVTDANLINGTGYATLLHTGTPMSVHTAERLACDAKISLRGAVDGQPALTDGTRLFTGKIRRLLELRDGGCAFPSCDRPPSWCDGHHVLAWLRGGPTSVGNGVLLCGYHHRLIHQGAWTVRMADDGMPEFVPPDWTDPKRNPLRNNRMRV